jgi:predicted regulator of Ras-like GTPase activity (Roadblock/LC7/MglB family)
MKLKLPGLFRGLFGSNGNPEPARPVAAAQPAVAVAAGAPAPKPISAASVMPSPAPQNFEQIEIPLAAVINSLPMDLKAKLIATPSPGKMIFLQVESVISQLAFGAVKITFGELRKLAPGIFVNSNSTYDSRAISLPLNEILSRINPTLLSRRTAAQKFEVAEDIAGPFGGRGSGVTFTPNPVKSPAPSAATSARSVAPTPSIPPAREIKPAAPISFTPPPPVPAPASEPIAFSPRQNTPLVAPIPFAEPPKPANGHNGSNGNGNGNPVLPPFKFTAAPVPPSAAPMPSAEAQPTISITLKELAENWPDEIRQEIILNNLAHATVPLPMALIEPGLKRGRVTMNWKDVRSLINPVLPAAASDTLDLDLPLKVLAPAFLTAQKKFAKTQSKVAVSAEIPNLFFGFPQPEAPVQPAFVPTPLPPSAAALAEPSIPAAQNPQNPQAPRISDTNLFSVGTNGSSAANESELFKRTPVPATDFLSRQMQPKDLVAHALTLPGVAGAIVALADGLRVAGEVPAEFKVDTFAAFLPQIYERVNQSTRELRMGALNNVSFTVGNVPWKIFRVNSIYFAAFGRAGEALPKAQLAALAAGLDRKQK